MDLETAFSNAEAICQGLGGHVSFFKTEEELEAYNAVKNGRREWLGIKRQNGNQWFTMDGVESTVFDWRDGEPNNFNGIEDCVETSNATGLIQWNDKRCDVNRLFSCRLETTVPFDQEC